MWCNFTHSSFAERARSISPQKSSPANTPPPSSHRIDHNTSFSHSSFSNRLNLESSPILDPPSPRSHSPPKAEEMGGPGDFSLASKENEFPIDSDRKQSGQTSPTRSRGLSWQKRPTSQASERSRTRPLSVVAAENAARNPTLEPTSATEPNFRDQSASALSFKDPSWSRQTADISVTTTQQSGTPRTPSGEAPKEDIGPLLASPTITNRLASPLSLSGPQKLDPPISDAKSDTEFDQEQSGVMSPTSGRTSPSRADRSGSPTKGMGGFVQSAMMKRSDSIKRWSVQSPTGVPRTEPVVSHRTGGSKSRPASMIRGTSIDLSPSQPPEEEGGQQGEEAFPSEKPAESLRIEIKPAPAPQEEDVSKPTPPVSPSKSMDSRRWSPTKSSWLESALNKPESPKPRSNTTSSPPAWMAEIQKAKAEKAANPSAERKRSPTVGHRHQVSIGGLMRTSAPGTTAKPVGLGLPSPSITPSATTPSIASPSITSPSVSTRPENISAPKELQSPMIPKVKSPSPEYNPMDSALPVTKPKPEVPAKLAEAPGKLDFRANLKPRQPSATPNSGEDTEFKNVFGKLRKTTTQNYVAPDELKGNILRGKASLNNTGGPKKSERVDELREAILARKKDFEKAQSEGRGVARNDSSASEKPVPEGLLKRVELGRSNMIRRDSATSETVDPQKPAVTPTREPLQAPPFGSRLQRFNSAEDRDPALDPDRPIIPRRGSALVGLASKDSDPPPATQKEAITPGRFQVKPGGNALANRFNPALAGLLARGPPGAAPASSTGSTSISSSRPITSSGADDTGSGSTPKLTHMTKGRARGPKRKAPTSAATTSVAPAGSIEPKENPTRDSPPPAQSPISTPNPPRTPLADSSRIGQDAPTGPRPLPISLGSASKKSFEPSPEEVPSKVSTSPSKIHEQVAAFPVQRRPRSPTKVSEEPKESTSQPSSPRKLDMKRMSRFLDDPNVVAGKIGDQEPNDAKKSIDLPSAGRPKSSYGKPPSPSALESQPQSPSLNKPRTPLQESISLASPRRPSVDAIKSTTSSGPPSTVASGGRPLPAVPPTLGRDLPSLNRPLPAEPRGPRSPPIPSPTRSPTKQLHDASTLLGDFFGRERPKGTYDVDAADLLMQRPNVAPTKIQTLNTQLFQFLSDGKRVPVPTHYERTLFEREMYICSHTFKEESGKKVTEVYFWVGDDVPHSDVEDASAYTSREAKALGGKLIRLQQGKETPEFLQALGGIVIFQRGSSNKFDSLAPHLLCGRRFHGHIVFDELDFTPATLCSGFPYVVTTGMKCYLWKGKGSGVDEISCARLIYAPEEIEDGHEPESFWGLFATNSKPVSADHWRLKSNYDQYCCRLFCSNAASKQQVSYTLPFHHHTQTCMY